MMHDSHPVRVAWLMGTDLRPYRVPFLKRLAARTEIEVTVLHGNAKPGIGAPVTPPDLQDDRITLRPIVNRFWPLGGHRVMWQSGVISILREGFDVIVVPEIVHNLTVWSIAAFIRRARSHLALFGFGYRSLHSTIGSKLKGMARRVLLRRADVIITYTERGRSECLTGGIKPSRLFVLQNTLDTEHLGAIGKALDPTDLEEVKDRYSLGDSFVVACLGRLVPEKHIEVLIQAFSQLRTRGIDASLLIVGDGPERASLESLASDLGTVHFTGAIYEESGLAQLLLASDVMVIPGRIGLTCVHGFSYSVPTVTTSDRRVEQSPEYSYLRDQDNALILDDLDAGLYADALEELATDRRKLESLREGAARAAGRLTMSRMVDEFVEAVLTARR